MLIFWAFPVMQINTEPNEGHKGHIITLNNDVQQLADILPKHPKYIPVIVFKFKDNVFKMLKKC